MHCSVTANVTFIITVIVISSVSVTVIDLVDPLFFILTWILTYDYVLSAEEINTNFTVKQHPSH